jgi:uncharacterized glyoxalase superfamily protein PhnB
MSVWRQRTSAGGLSVATRPWYHLAMATSLRVLDIRPSIEVADVATALAFWTDTVGLDVEATMGTPPVFAIVAHGDARIALVGAAEPARPTGAAVYVTIDGLDALLARLATAGVELVVPLTDRPWGVRDVVAACPGGGPLVAFGEALPG